MGQIYIVTNFSKIKTRYGPQKTAYVKLDGRPVSINHDLITFKACGKHTLRFGYTQHIWYTQSSVKREDLKQDLNLDNHDHWYQYNVPSFFHAAGQLKEISEIRYRLLKSWCIFLNCGLNILAVILFLLFGFSCIIFILIK